MHPKYSLTNHWLPNFNHSQANNTAATAAHANKDSALPPVLEVEIAKYDAGSSINNTATDCGLVNNIWDLVG